ncbi:carbon monoxide dehydrogenase subunit G [Actinocorallia herbida]|uniref:Carbon monoxide dehydrogenase subunit G n=1 Tax=Actinocorallia herbida TaxID=58109 RepID=A0A3N1CXC1_9ACTN|nr:SRPBCC family protein [Actinocorallia herbida]ROO85943.1 carbon monoxide dehydrogenase subunit G [Actinocorallia herbida]
MKLQNDLRIPVPAAEAWAVLLDIERIAPCVPGATLTSHEGDTFGGKVKVKLGPIGLTYSGTVAFVSLDEAARVAVLEASGRETRGGGTAKATVTCTLTGDGSGTDVLIDTDLAITGKPAQFGRSTLADVATSLIGQFAANLAAHLAESGSAAAAPEQPPPEEKDAAPAAPAPRPTPAAPAAPIDLLQPSTGLLRHLAPPAGAAAVLLVLIALLRRRRSRGPA